METLPSRLSYVDAGLAGLAAYIEASRTWSIAIPHLGCSHGGSSWTDFEADEHGNWTELD